MDHAARSATPSAAWWLTTLLALLVAVLHAALLSLQTALDLSPQITTATSDPQRALTALCGAWWLAAGVLGLVRRGGVDRAVVVLLPGHVAALSAMGLLSSAPGVPWCSTMALVTLPVVTGLRWSPRLTRTVALLAAAGAAATTFDAVGGRAGAGFGAFAALCTAVAVTAPALAVLRLEARLRAVTEAALRQAVTDPLTGLLNRRGLDEGAAGLTGRRAPDDATGLDLTCVVVMDVDRFKAVNDDSGHEVGDLVLRAVADVLRQHVRAEDLLVRHGGEEFAWVGRWPDAASAVRSAERVRAAVARAPMPHGRPVTLSLGVATTAGHDAPCPEDRRATPAGTVHRLVARADAALYTAKRTGRDRVVLAADEPAVGQELTAGAAAPGSAAGGC